MSSLEFTIFVRLVTKSIVGLNGCLDKVSSFLLIFFCVIEKQQKNQKLSFNLLQHFVENLNIKIYTKSKSCKIKCLLNNAFSNQFINWVKLLCKVNYSLKLEYFIKKGKVGAPNESRNQSKIFSVAKFKTNELLQVSKILTITGILQRITIFKTYWSTSNQNCLA